MPRVVITAMGAITPLGGNEDAITRHLSRFSNPFVFSSSDPQVVICPVPDFDLRQISGRHKNHRYLSRGAAFAVAAATLALEQAGWSDKTREAAGLFMGAGPYFELSTYPPRDCQGEVQWEKAPALWMLPYLPNTAASLISQQWGIHGENLVTANACAASLQAIGEGFRRIKNGYLKAAIAGGGDSRLNSDAIKAYQKAGALCHNPPDPQTACRPFDKHRAGFVSGEGGAFFTLESLNHALARNATILAEIMGYGSSLDGHAMTAPDPSGVWAEKAVHQALSEAALNPQSIDVVSAHGTGTPQNDLVEATMLRTLFGNDQPVITALKSWMGHLSSACGAAELALCLTMLKNGHIPEIRNLESPCLEGLVWVTRPLKQFPETVLLENFGFGGKNAALVIGKWKP